MNETVECARSRAFWRLCNTSLPVFYVFWNITKGAQKSAFAVDGAVVQHLNAPQNAAQLTGLLSCANITFSKQINGAELSCESSVFHKYSRDSVVFSKLVLLSNSSLSDAFTLTQLLTEQGKHSFAGTLPTLMAGTVRHQRYTYKPRYDPTLTHMSLFHRF